MRGKSVIPKVSYERLREVLEYHPASGEFYWKVTLPRNVKAGDRAGVRDKTKQSGRGYIVIDGESITLPRLAWFYMTKEWPEHRVKFLNEDTNDLRFENLAQFTGIPGEFDYKTREGRIAYQRAYRKIVAPVKSKMYDQMFEAQNGVCKICGNPETHRRNGRIKALAIDHCHKTGVIRGLLCCDCNTGIGKLKDDPRVLRQAAEYLENYLGSPALQTGLADAAQTSGRNLVQEV